ncbi:MAG: hypothetical protein NC095_02945 [Muribaculum sp.]|nr:hypothetical protein [Muribaculum sp.]
MAKFKKKGNVSSVDSKMDTAKNVIRKTGEIAGEVGKTLVAVASAYVAYKELKDKRKS